VENLIESLDNESCETVGVIVGPPIHRYTTGAHSEANKSKHNIILTTTNNIIENLKKTINKILKQKIIYSFFKIILFILIPFLFIYFFIHYINIYIFILLYSILLLSLFYFLFIN